MKRSSFFRIFIPVCFVFLSRISFGGIEPPFQKLFDCPLEINNLKPFGEIPDEYFAHSGKDKFFNNLDPHTSAPGQVKTFIVKVVPQSRSSYLKIERIGPHDPNLKYSGGSLSMPVSGRISSYFGSRRHPKSGKSRFHAGIDISAKRGTPIKAAASGRVSQTGWSRGYGMIVVVDHGGGLQTVYAHCSKILVKKGDGVSAGETIAKVGNTGITTGTHLHFEVRRNGDVRNPMKFLSR